MSQDTGTPFELSISEETLSPNLNFETQMFNICILPYILPLPHILMGKKFHSYSECVIRIFKKCQFG